MKLVADKIGYKTIKIEGKMAENGFLNEVLRRIANAGRMGLGLRLAEEKSLIELCQDLLGDMGEASGLVCALEILNRYEVLDVEEKQQFFSDIVENFGIDDDQLSKAIDDWKPGDVDAARRIHFASEPQSQNLIRVLNRVPGVTGNLVRMRADLLKFAKKNPELRGFDKDFRHLFASWFNRGFLELRHIDWNTPAAILEKIIEYEAVHEIADWKDLRQRVGDPDRRLFAFFHPAMPADPLIFVEVALTTSIPGDIVTILSPERQRIDAEEANTAVFYSISNCQPGLRGVSFGNFLIKQVVVDLQHELPDLTTFVTLSPVPGLRKWVAKSLEENDPLVTNIDADALESPDEKQALQIAANYLLKAKRPQGTAFDPVAHFHLGNGAILQDIHTNADTSDTGLDNSWGIMVNYLYDGEKIETNHQAYANDHTIAASAKVRALLKK